MCSGAGTPKSQSAVGAMSISAGSSRSMDLLLKNTPGTILGSTQWSPLHAFTLSSNTRPATTPVAPSHEMR